MLNSIRSTPCIHLNLIIILCFLLGMPKQKRQIDEIRQSGRPNQSSQMQNCSVDRKTVGFNKIDIDIVVAGSNLIEIECFQNDFAIAGTGGIQTRTNNLSSTNILPLVYQKGFVSIAEP